MRVSSFITLPQRLQLVDCFSIWQYRQYKGATPKLYSITEQIWHVHLSKSKYGLSQVWFFLFFFWFGTTGWRRPSLVTSIFYEMTTTSRHLTSNLTHFASFEGSVLSPSLLTSTLTSKKKKKKDLPRFYSCSLVSAGTGRKRKEVTERKRWSNNNRGFFCHQKQCISYLHSCVQSPLFLSFHYLSVILCLFIHLKPCGDATAATRPSTTVCNIALVLSPSWWTSSEN